MPLASFLTFAAPQDVPKLNRFCHRRKGPFLADTYRFRSVSYRYPYFDVAETGLRIKTFTISLKLRGIDQLPLGLRRPFSEDRFPRTPDL